MANIPKESKARVAYDFRPLVKMVEEGKITRHEYEEVFRKKRLEGGRLGASTAPIVAGLSNFSTAELEYAKRMHMLKKINTDAEEIKWPFELGHMAEDIIRETFSLKTGLRATRCDIAYTNDNYPFMFVNPDGFVYEKDENGRESITLLEIKTTYMKNSEHAELFRRGIVPEDYLAQVQVQLEITNLNRCYLVYAWGWADYQQIHFVIERDREYACEICQMLGVFHNWLTTGVRPKDGFNANVKAIMNSCAELYPFGDKDLPKKKLGADALARAERYEELEKKKAGLEKELKALPLSLEISALKKEMDEIKALLSNELCDATCGEAKDKSGNCFLIKLSTACEPSFDAKNKKYIKENYPSLWDELMKRSPKSRKFSLERIAVKDV